MLGEQICVDDALMVFKYIYVDTFIQMYEWCLNGG